MKKDTYYSSKIYTPLMAGLFVGYIVRVLNLVYDVAFRNFTDFPLHELINVSTIIFATLIALTLAGTLYALFEKISRTAGTIYIVCSALFTAYCIYGSLHVHRSDNAVINGQFHNLLLGIVVITGLAATFAVPYLVKHNDIFIGDNN